MKSVLFFFERGSDCNRESMQPWTGLGFWLVSVPWYGNLGNLNTRVSFQEEHFREGCKFIGGAECFSFWESSTDSISIYPGPALEIRCSFYLRRVSEEWRRSLDLARYPEFSAVILQKKGGERNMTLIITRYWPRLRPSSASCCGGASEQEGGAPLSLQTNWSPFTSLKDPDCLISHWQAWDGI